MKRMIHDYKVLWTRGDKSRIMNNMFHVNDIGNSNIWIHDGIVEKNNTDMSITVLDFICDISNYAWISMGNLPKWGEDYDMVEVRETHYIMTPHKFR